MFDLQATEITAPIVQWAEIRPGAPYRPPTSLSAKNTRFLTDEAGNFDIFEIVSFSSSTPANELLQASIGQAKKSAPPAEAKQIGSVGVDEIASQRIRLLAAKYAGGPNSKEIGARLAILNARLLEKSPVVTQSEVAALEGISQEVAELTARRRARAERLGLAV